MEMAKSSQKCFNAVLSRFCHPINVRSTYPAGPGGPWPPLCPGFPFGPAKNPWLVYIIAKIGVGLENE